MGGPFAIPLPAWRLLGQQPKSKSRRQYGDNEDHATSASPTPEAETPTASLQLPSNSINPRSHSPNTLRQFAVAGLSPEEEVPSKAHPNFPHKALPPDHLSARGGRPRRSSSRGRMSAMTSGSEADVDTDASEGGRQRRRMDEDEMMTTGSPSARIKHIDTMMTILHRCLHEGDIARAKRAFALLTRTKDVDIRLHGMWSIGTEILMRDGEEKRQDPVPPGSRGEETSNAGPDPAAPRKGKSLPRWGSAANIDKVKGYLENLIQQHPHDPHRPHLTSAFDFWPALFSIEIYNTDAEFRQALHRLDQEESGSPETIADNESEPPLSQPSGSEDYASHIHNRLEENHSQTTYWAARDEIRRETQSVAQQISIRMDQLMEVLPYSTHLELLRLRGMLALFIGDLYLSSRRVERRGLDGELHKLSLREDLRKEVENEQDRDGLRHRQEELQKARGYFRRMREKGGKLDLWLVKLLESDDDDEGDGDGDQEMVDSPSSLS